MFVSRALPDPMLKAYYRGPLFLWVAGFAIGLTLFSLASTPILRSMANFLIVEDALEPAQAIVSLAGQTPYREMEAAKLYQAGWAPQIIIVGRNSSDRCESFRNSGRKKNYTWEMSREILMQHGVPQDAILVLSIKSGGTLEELREVYNATRAKRMPMILVTSKYHTRRTRLAWTHLSGGDLRPVVRAATDEPFDPSDWWRHRRFALSVIHEYLGLVNYYARFAMAW